MCQIGTYFSTDIGTNPTEPDEYTGSYTRTDRYQNGYY
jgi:hypothetical protein